MPKFYPKPEYSRTEVNKAGNIIIDPSATEIQREWALTVINNWRTSHNFPLNTFQIRLRDVARKINPDSLVAQRIKRLASIKLKLELQPEMKMSQMQDLGGCRAIMKDVQELDELVDIYKHKSRGIKHTLHKEQDYVANPKSSGYRGIHLVYKYGSDKSSDFKDMRIEIQMRTLMQHAWATAVETVGTFINMPLKSSLGDQGWLRFFALMGSAMAISEGKPSVPGTSGDINELKEEIIFLSKKLEVESHLKTFRNSIQVMSSERKSNDSAYYYLLDLDPDEGRVIVRSYTQNQLKTASVDYMALEKRITNGKRDAVLVSADSIKALKLAYPNYYLDTDIFLQQLKDFTDTGKFTGQLTLF
jgi:uncharacterized UPF0146 family protein